MQVVCEGRATGDAGIYRRDGEPRTGLIDEIVHEVDQAKLIFEAPKKAQQVRFIEVLGPQVNLGNVLPADALSLETLRLGLRADTLKLFHDFVANSRQVDVRTPELDLPDFGQREQIVHQHGHVRDGPPNSLEVVGGPHHSAKHTTSIGRPARAGRTAGVTSVHLS